MIDLFLLIVVIIYLSYINIEKKQHELDLLIDLYIYKCSNW